MGYRTHQIEVSGRVSDHHDDRDKQDREAWEKFVTQVRELAARPEYAELDIEVTDRGSW